MKRLFLILFSGIMAICLFSCKNKTQQTPQKKQPVKEFITLPPSNNFLAGGDYALPGFQSALTNGFSTPVKAENFQVFTLKLQQIIPALFPYIALNSAVDGYYWIKGERSIYYIDATKEEWKPISEWQMKDAKEVNLSKMNAFASKNYTLGDSLKQDMEQFYGAQALQPLNSYASLVDNNDVLYTVFGTSLNAFSLEDHLNPSKGIKLKKELNLKSSLSKTDLIVGIQMTFDGYLLLNSAEGMFIIVDRESLTIQNQMQIIPVQHFFSTAAVDEKNGIYALSDSLMIKLVWNGKTLSSLEEEGAWSCPITYDRDSLLIAKGGGSLSSPVLMGFGDDPDKLVVIFDGAKRSNLIAFWRDEIPKDTMNTKAVPSRIADQIAIHCGQPKEDMPLIQSYHMPAVYGYGVFFANTLNGFKKPNTPLDLALTGSILPCAKGVERFQWDYIQHRWQSLWGEPNVVTSPMQPVISTAHHLVMFSSYDNENSVIGWNIKGLDWTNATLRTQIIFSTNTQYGNGANGYFQFMKNGDLIFNSMMGTYRVTLGEDRGLNRAPRL